MSSPDLHPAERSRQQYCFADFILDLDGGFLRRAGEEISLRPKTFEVLAYLVKHHDRLVTKTALIETVWPDTAITDNSLAQCLVEIRRALGDDSQQLIRTVKGRGYVFAAPLTAPVIEFPIETARKPAPLPAVTRRPLNRYVIIGVFVLMATAAGLFLVWRIPSPKHELTYTQLTNFTDSVVSPALSPDGRLLAFFRGEDWWLTRGPIYVKLLPDGEPVPITNDPRPKYGLAFSPDGSRIAYTVAPGWDTYTIAPLGHGEPKLLLANAAGLTWLDERRVLFSEMRTGLHMGLVTARENRSDHRTIYFPRDVRGMVHLSYASPDGKWALLVEMDPVWQPCRVVPMDGSSAGWQVGPKGKCTAAAWSPDSKWMYFGVEMAGNHHLWRQRFPKGQPEQITFGPTGEDGVAVAQDGSLITSIGIRQGAVWIRDARNDRAISSEGYTPTVRQAGLFGTEPMFSPDGKSLLYLRSASREAAVELWRTELESGRTHNLVSGFSILEYDVSSDGKEAVFSTQPSGKDTQLWIAALDRSSPPKLIASNGETSPHFGPDGQILYRLSDGKTHYLARMKRDGSERSRIAPYPIGNVQTISPDRRWVVAITPLPDRRGGASMAAPIDGRPPHRICASVCRVRWAPDGKFLYLAGHGTSWSNEDKTLVLPIPPGETFPNLPASGIRGLGDAAAFPGSRIIDGYDIVPGPDPSVFAYVKTTVHRNLFRIPLPQ